MCGGRQKITEQYIEIQQEIADEMGFTWSTPTCGICKKQLEIGDYVDGFHPYHQEYNCCQDCDTEYVAEKGEHI